MSGACELEDLTIWAYRAELFGESLFTELGRAATDHLSECFDLLAQLERQTADTLGGLLDRLGVDRPAPDSDRLLGIDVAARLADLQAPAIWQIVVDGTEPALANYNRMRQLAPASESATLAEVVAHEMALARFATAELSRDTDSCRHLREVLRTGRVDHR